jgi:hypothetical protein
MIFAEPMSVIPFDRIPATLVDCTRSMNMKNKDEQTGLVGLAIGAAVIGLVSAQKPIHRNSIVDELVRLGRQKGDGVEDEVFVKAAELVRKGV